MSKNEARTEASVTKVGDEPKPPKRWGLDGDQVVEKRQKARVDILLHDGSTLSGSLVGYTEFNLTVRENGRVALLNKGHVVAVRPGKKPVEE